MPAKSKKQQRFMQAIANNPKFAKKVGVPQSVGKEFTMKKYAKGGAPMSSMRPRMRPEDMMDEEGSAAPRRSMRPKPRPSVDIGTMPGGGTRGVDPKEIYSEEDFKRLTGGMKKGGKVKEYGGKEVYSSKAAMKKHEKAESPAVERREGMKSGGKVRGCGMASKGVRPAKMV